MVLNALNVNQISDSSSLADSARSLTASTSPTVDALFAKMDLLLVLGAAKLLHSRFVCFVKQMSSEDRTENATKKMLFALNIKMEFV